MGKSLPIFPTGKLRLKEPSSLCKAGGSGVAVCTPTLCWAHATALLLGFRSPLQAPMFTMVTLRQVTLR